MLTRGHRRDGGGRYFVAGQKIDGVSQDSRFVSPENQSRTGRNIGHPIRDVSHDKPQLREAVISPTSAENLVSHKRRNFVHGGLLP